MAPGLLGRGGGVGGIRGGELGPDGDDKMIIQLNPPIWVQTPKGEGDALLIIDYGVHYNTVWVVHLFEDGQVLHFDSSDIRAMGNAMYGIPHPRPAFAPDRAYETPDHPL